MFLPASAVKDLPAPDDAALKDYYDKHPDAYTAPEYRGFTALFLQNADVAAEREDRRGQAQGNLRQAGRAG